MRADKLYSILDLLRPFLVHASYFDFDEHAVCVTPITSDQVDDTTFKKLAALGVHPNEDDLLSFFT
jgi:hypothetical protein